MGENSDVPLAALDLTKTNEPITAGQVHDIPHHISESDAGILRVTEFNATEQAADPQETEDADCLQRQHPWMSTN